MFEILALLVLMAWVVFSIWITARVTRLVIHGALKFLIFVFLAPLLSALPLADEIIGKFQFDRLCKEAEEVNIYGTMPVGVELYTADGKWRLSTSPPIPLDEYNRVRTFLESLVQYEYKPPVNIAAAMPIQEYETRVVRKDNGEPLAAYRYYATSGGWISRGFEKPTLVRDQCIPSTYSIQRVLPFDRVSKGDK